MSVRAAWLFDAVAKLVSNRIVLAILATGAAVYMYRQAHSDGVLLARSNGFGSDFRGTIWIPDRAVIHGVSPYPSASQTSGVEPAVYLPPIFLVTFPLGWLSLHAATWVWFGCLMASALGVLAVLGVRDPWCYALMLMSLPVVEALVLGNASLLVVFGAALAWRFRDRSILGPAAVAATVAIKFWLWPLIVWLLMRRLRAGVRAAVAFAAITLGSWAVIGFHGLLGYPALMHTEARLFVHGGVLFVAALVQLNVAVTIASAAGFLGGLVLLGTAWIRRSNEVESFALVLLASLIATPVAWPHYLALLAVPIVILWPILTLGWAWFPALWLAIRAGQQFGQVGQSIALSLFAVSTVAIVVASQNGGFRHAQPLRVTPRERLI